MKLIEFSDVQLEVNEHPEHEWTLTTKQVAEGYGVTENLLKMHIRNNPKDFVDGKHYFVLKVSNPDVQKKHGGARRQTVWTKRGVVRLGFFIRSERARAFRDLAEDLVIRKLSDELANTYVGLFLQELPEAWEHTFRDSFFCAVCDCYGLRWIKGKTPGFFGGFINRYIYEPLLVNLSPELKAKRKDYCSEVGTNEASYKLHQFLQEHCKRSLEQHISNVETLLAVSRDEVEFKEHFARRFEGIEQLRLEFQTKADRKRMLKKGGAA